MLSTPNRSSISATSISITFYHTLTLFTIILSANVLFKPSIWTWISLSRSKNMWTSRIQISFGIFTIRRSRWIEAEHRNVCISLGEKWGSGKFCRREERLESRWRKREGLLSLSHFVVLPFISHFHSIHSSHCSLQNPSNWSVLFIQICQNLPNMHKIWGFYRVNRHLTQLDGWNSYNTLSTKNWACP